MASLSPFGLTVSIIISIKISSDEKSVSTWEKYTRAQQRAVYFTDMDVSYKH